MAEKRTMIELPDPPPYWIRVLDEPVLLQERVKRFIKTQGKQLARLRHLVNKEGSRP